MPSKIKVLQVIPKLGYGGAEIGCYDLAHYLNEQGCSSFIVTSGGALIKYIDRKKVKLIRLPVQSKNPLLIILNSVISIIVLLFSIFLGRRFLEVLFFLCFLFSGISSSLVFRAQSLFQP